MQNLFIGLLMLMSFPLFAETKAESHDSPQIEAKKSAGEEICDCECEYKKHNCDAVKASLPKLEQNKIKICGGDKDDPGALNRTLGCLNGVADATIMAWINLPPAVWNEVSDNVKCDNDPIAKLHYMRNVIHAYSDIVPGKKTGEGDNMTMAGDMINTWSCGAIKREVMNRENSWNKSYIDKKIAIKNELEGQGKTPTEAELQKLTEEKLSKNEREYFKHVGPPGDPAAAMIKKHGEAWNCYNRREVARLVCDEVTTTVSIAASIAGISKLAAKNAAKEAAKDMAKSRMLDEAILKDRGPRYDTFGDGNWLSRHHKSLPDDVVNRLTQIKGGYRIYGDSVRYGNSPIPGVSVLEIQGASEKGKTLMSAFLGHNEYASNIPLATRLAQRAAIDAGITLKDQSWIGTTDPLKMREFLKLNDAYQKVGATAGSDKAKAFAPYTEPTPRAPAPAN